VELVGTPTLRDTLRATVLSMARCASPECCQTSGQCRDFYPIDYIPNGVRLTAYSGEASDLPPAVLQEFLDVVAAGAAKVPIGKTYTLEDIVQAHQDMEEGTVTGKLIFTVSQNIDNV
jgi:NADPH:quinone reductase